MKDKKRKKHLDRVHDKTLDKELAEAFRRRFSEEEAALAMGEEHEFSPEFTEKLNELTARTDRNMDKGGQTMKTRKMIGILAAAALLVTTAVCAYAMLPELREKINLLFLKQENMAPLTEVPEGYIGIYTTEDLNNIRYDLDECYILMNDIQFDDSDYHRDGPFSGGFVPIGDKNTPFIGLFNGNGYVIYNLQINSTNNGYAGLFGYAETVYHLREGNEFPEELPQTTGGIIKNLGIEDSRVILRENVTYEEKVIDGQTLTQTRGTIRYAGIIAGRAEYVAGCYVKNSTIEVTLQVPRASYVGGVAGYTTLTDSCYTDADIIFTVESRTNPDIPAGGEIPPYISGVTGSNLTCVTSYFNGTIDSDGWENHGVSLCDLTVPPILLNEGMVYDILVRFLQYSEIPVEKDATLEELEEIVFSTKNPTGALRQAQKLFAFYRSHPYEEATPYVSYDDFFTSEEKPETVYILDPETTAREYRVLTETIHEVFDGTFYDLCQKHGLKYGFYGCYDLRETPDADFADFDMDYIWYMKDGLPDLRLFRNHEKTIVTERGDYSEYAEKMNQMIR